MTRTQQVARRTSTSPETEGRAASQGSAARNQSQALAPPADVFEDKDGITILLDMPGVTRDRLTVRADRNGLEVEGDASIEMPEGMEAAYAEIRSLQYRRTFVLTSEFNTDAVEASMKDGVLTIRVPKRAELKPRQIEIQTA